LGIQVPLQIAISPPLQKRFIFLVLNPSTSFLCSETLIEEKLAAAASDDSIHIDKENETLSD